MFLVRPRHQGFIWYYVWEHLLIIYHPAKFCDHSHWDSEDIMFLVDGEQHMLSLKSAIVVYFYNTCNKRALHVIPASLILVTHFMSNKLQNTDKKRLFQSVSETPTSRKRRKNYKKGYCKTFYVTRNTKGNQDSVLQSFLRYTKMKLINIYNNTCYSKLQKRLWYSFFPMLSFQTNKTCNFCLLYIIEGP